MAGLDAYKKPLMWPWGACWLRRPGERQAGPPRRSDGSGLGLAFACAVGRSETLLQSFKRFKGFRGFRVFKGFKRLGAGKRQAWTPIRSHWCGLGVPVDCECLANGRLDRPEEAMVLALGSETLLQSFKRFKGFRGFRGFKGFKHLGAGKRQAWPWGACWLRMPGERQPGPPRRSDAIDVALGCLLTAKAWRTAGWTAQKKRWILPWGSFCLRSWAFRDAFAEF